MRILFVSDILNKALHLSFTKFYLTILKARNDPNLAFDIPLTNDLYLVQVHSFAKDEPFPFILTWLQSNNAQFHNSELRLRSVPDYGTFSVIVHEL